MRDGFADGFDADWMTPAFDYVRAWIDHQAEEYQQTGAAIAVVDGAGRLFEYAVGLANAAMGEKLTPRHLFRCASHSKTFTAAAILKLREQRRLGLDDPIGLFVEGLDPLLSQARIADLLSHGAGCVRDGADCCYYANLRPFAGREEVLAALAPPQPLEPGVRFKYSNYGYALLGQIIVKLTKKPYEEWLAQEILAPARLRETYADIAFAPVNAPLAVGHSRPWIAGQRIVLTPDNPTRALAPAAGLVSSAADLALFFKQIDPASPSSVLSVESRREMVRRRWREEAGDSDIHYGFGVVVGGDGADRWFGHSGTIDGYASHTIVSPSLGAAVSVLCNADDGFAQNWCDGIVNILRAFQAHGPADPALAHWRGRWWGFRGALDVVPMGARIICVTPSLFTPFEAGAPILRPIDGQTCRIVQSTGFGYAGECARLVCDCYGTPAEFWLGAARFSPKDQMIAALRSSAANRFGRMNTVN